MSDVLPDPDDEEIGWPGGQPGGPRQPRKRRKTCPTCDGAGEVPRPVHQDRDSGQWDVVYIDCPRCTPERARSRPDRAPAVAPVGQPGDAGRKSQRGRERS